MILHRTSTLYRGSGGRLDSAGGGPMAIGMILSSYRLYIQTFTVTLLVTVVSTIDILTVGSTVVWVENGRYSTVVDCVIIYFSILYGSRGARGPWGKRDIIVQGTYLYLLSANLPASRVPAQGMNKWWRLPISRSGTAWVRGRYIITCEYDVLVHVRI